MSQWITVDSVDGRVADSALPLRSDISGVAMRCPFQVKKEIV